MRAIAILTFCFLFGCTREPVPAPAADGDHADERTHNAHDPQMGGRLVEIGEHFAQVEFVLEPATGTLTAYVWDGHVHHNVKVGTKTIEVRIDGRNVTLEHVELGDKFVGRSDMLKGARRLKGSIPKLVVMGETFKGVAFDLAFDEE